MPELPEVETARRLAERALGGKRLVAVAAADDRIVYEGVTPRTFIKKVTGARVECVGRRGKQMWLELDRRPWPLLHFGMTGRFWVYDTAADRPRHWKVELACDDGVRLAMTDPRRFGRIRLQHDPLSDKPIAALGFDPLLDLPRSDVLFGLLGKRRGPIKAVLLDQSLAAGVGNWIADEVLYQARIAPRRRACDLSADEVKRLRGKLSAIVRKAVDVEADKQRFPRTWLFHKRWGKQNGATIAGHRIVHETIGGRTTAWVPKVQR